MDTSTTITDLPASAQRVLARHLSSLDAGSCRQASRLLAGVAADASGSDTRLQVVANTFKAQIEADARAHTQHILLECGGGEAEASSSAAAGQTVEPLPPASYTTLCTAISLARASQGVRRAEVLVDASRPCRQDVWSALFRSLLSSSTLCKLTVTEYCFGTSQDVSRGVRMRGLTSSILEHWTAAQQQYGSSTVVAAQHTSPGSGLSQYNSSSAGLPWSMLAVDNCAWLPALVDAANTRLQLVAAGSQGGASQATMQQQQQEAGRGVPLKLTLRLLSPLLPEHWVQLVQVQGLAGLHVYKTPAWLGADSRVLMDTAEALGWGLEYPSSITPPLPTCMLGQIQGLRQLTSLCGTCEGVAHGQAATQVATSLHVLLLGLGSQLTQLSLGASQTEQSFRTHYLVAAPLRGMPALQSLTCNLGVSLDVEEDEEEVSTQQILQAAAGPQAAAGSNSSTSSGEGPSTAALLAPAAGAGLRSSNMPPPLLPSLTRLLLLEPVTVPDVLRLLSTSEPACKQLQHLEIPELKFYDADEPAAPDYNAPQGQQQPLQDLGVAVLQRLQTLKGLRQLRAVVAGQQQLDALVSAVGDRLRGLTVTCSRMNPLYLPIGFNISASQVQLQPLLTGMAQLTILKVVGSNGAVLDPNRHLAAAAQHLTALQSLSYTGRMFALPDPGFQLLPGLLPSTLQGLTLVARQSATEGFDLDGSYTLHPGCFPQGLTSLKSRGFWWRPPDEQQVDRHSPWFAWQWLPRGLRQLEVDVQAALWDAGSGSIVPVSSAAGAAAHAARAAGNSSIAVHAHASHAHPPAAAAAAAAEVSAAETAAGAAAQASNATPHWVVLPELQSLALFLRGDSDVHGGLYAAPPAGLPLAAVCGHLGGLTSLTQLHICSEHSRAGDSVQGLMGLVQLQVLSLDVGSKLYGRDGTVTADEALGRELEQHLARMAGLRVLRLPEAWAKLGAPQELLQRLEARLPNCLIVQAEETPLDSSMLAG